MDNTTFAFAGKKLSVVIPAYNEEHRIAKTLLSVDDFLRKQSFDYEILVVNDGSSDNTAQVVIGLESKIKNLKLIDNAENHGKGWVVRQGMLAATGEIRLFMDADNSTTVDEVLAMLPLFGQGNDIVLGSRRVKGSLIAVHQPWLRDLEGGIFRMIVHAFVPLGVTDSQCGFKAFSAAAAQAIFPRQRIFRWAFDVEILAIAKQLGFKFKEVPVKWMDDAGTHVRFSGKINMLLEVMEVRWNFLMGKYS